MLIYRGKGMENLYEKIKKFNLKDIKRDNLIIMLLSGVLFLVITIPTDDKNEKKAAKKAENEITQMEAKDTEKSYEKELEKRLEDILSHVEGVGSVRTMITLKASRELIVEKDIPTQRSKVTEKDADGGSRTTVEENISESTIYLKDGSNESKPYVVKELEPEIEGVVVLAQGGDNVQVKAKISEAVQALFAVEPHKIKVMKMN